jgi:hypothetical protein
MRQLLRHVARPTALHSHNLGRTLDSQQVSAFPRIQPAQGVPTYKGHTLACATIAQKQISPAKAFCAPSIPTAATAGPQVILTGNVANCRATNQSITFLPHTHNLLRWQKPKHKLQESSPEHLQASKTVLPGPAALPVVLG